MTVTVQIIPLPLAVSALLLAVSMSFVTGLAIGEVAARAWRELAASV